MNCAILNFGACLEVRAHGAEPLKTAAIVKSCGCISIDDVAVPDLGDACDDFRLDLLLNLGTLSRANLDPEFGTGCDHDSVHSNTRTISSTCLFARTHLYDFVKC